MSCALAGMALCFTVAFAYMAYKAEAYVLPYELNNTVTRLPFSQNQALPCSLIEGNSRFIEGRTFRFPATAVPSKDQTTTTVSRPHSTSLVELYHNNLLKTYGFHPHTPNAPASLSAHNPFLESLLTVESPPPYIQETNQCDPAEGWTSLLVFSHRNPVEYKGSSQPGRIAQYRHMAERHARKYNLPASLVMAIIKAESNFNPHAVSAQQAIGLMQIVPNTAGEEVHTYLHGSPSTPSLDTLFQPDHNILYGTTYLHLLEKRYFQHINDQTSRQLCIIAAYNGGPGAVLRVFDNNMDTAVSIINSMTPDEIYSALSDGMPFAESRRYIDLVLGNIRNF